MITRGQANAAQAKAFSEVRRTFRLMPTSVAVVRNGEGWGLRIGLPREPEPMLDLHDIDGVPIEFAIVGAAALLR